MLPPGPGDLPLADGKVGAVADPSTRRSQIRWLPEAELATGRGVIRTPLSVCVFLERITNEVH
jgi:hypothetical protein